MLVSSVSLICCSKQEAVKYLGIPQDQIEKIIVKQEGKPLVSESPDYNLFLESFKKYCRENPKINLRKKGKKKKYFFEIEAISKFESQEIKNNEKMQYVIQISLFESKSKNKIAEQSFDCCQ